jgi:hypothetical protein
VDECKARVGGERRHGVGDRARNIGALGGAMGGATGGAVMPHFNGISMGLDVHGCIYLARDR